jgi:hypothetical protein
MSGAGAGAGPLSAASVTRIEERVRDIFRKVHLSLDMLRGNERFINPIVNAEAHKLLRRIDADCEDTYYLTVPPPPPARPELNQRQRRFLVEYPTFNYWRENNPANRNNNRISIPEPENWMHNAWRLNEQIRTEIAEANVPAAGYKRPRTRKARRSR